MDVEAPAYGAVQRRFKRPGSWPPNPQVLAPAASLSGGQGQIAVLERATLMSLPREDLQAEFERQQALLQDFAKRLEEQAAMQQQEAQQLNRTEAKALQYRNELGEATTEARKRYASEQEQLQAEKQQVESRLEQAWTKIQQQTMLGESEAVGYKAESAVLATRLESESQMANGQRQAAQMARQYAELEAQNAHRFQELVAAESKAAAQAREWSASQSQMVQQVEAAAELQRAQCQQQCLGAEATISHMQQELAQARSQTGGSHVELSVHSDMLNREETRCRDLTAEEQVSAVLRSTLLDEYSELEVEHAEVQEEYQEECDQRDDCEWRCEELEQTLESFEDSRHCPGIGTQVEAETSEPVAPARAGIGARASGPQGGSADEQDEPWKVAITKLTEVVTAMATMQRTHPEGDHHSKLLQALTEAARESSQKVRMTAPKVKCTDPASLKTELKDLKRYFNESKIEDRRTWFKVVRQLVEGTAKAEFDYFLNLAFGNEDKYQAKLCENDPEFWESRWADFETRLKVAVNLDGECDLSSAMSAFSDVRLTNKTSVSEAAKFLEAYKTARIAMRETGQLNDDDELAMTREKTEFKKKIAGSNMLRYLLALPEWPPRMASDEAIPTNKTVLGACKKYIQIEEALGSGGSKSAAAEPSLLQMGGSEKKTMKEKRAAAKARKAEDKAEALKSLTQLLAFDRSAAARDPSKGGGKGVGKELKKGGGGDCPRCKGTHPECKECPNSAATKDDKFDVSDAAKKMMPCWYRHPGSKMQCNGCGHMVRHHVQALTPEAAKENEAAREKRLKEKEAKGGGKSKGNGKGKTAQRLDFSDDTAQPAEAQTGAQRLLAALLCFEDEAQETSERQVHVFDEYEGGFKRVLESELHDLDTQAKHTSSIKESTSDIVYPVGLPSTYGPELEEPMVSSAGLPFGSGPGEFSNQCEESDNKGQHEHAGSRPGIGTHGTTRSTETRSEIGSRDKSGGAGIESRSGIGPRDTTDEGVRQRAGIGTQVNADTKAAETRPGIGTPGKSGTVIPSANTGSGRFDDEEVIETRPGIGTHGKSDGLTGATQRPGIGTRGKRGEVQGCDWRRFFDRCGFRLTSALRSVGRVGTWMLQLAIMVGLVRGAMVPETVAYHGGQVDMACRHLLAEGLGDTSVCADRPPRSDASFLVQELAPGYNCRGNIWFTAAKCESVFDTGSSRNSIDKGYLKALLENDRTSHVVEDVVAVKPMSCRSVDRNNPITIKQVAYINTTFRESGTKVVTKLLSYCVVDQSTEDVILGKPTLDSLGFVSDKYSIDLRHEDIRFATILPKELPKGGDQFLHLAEHQEFDGRDGATQVHSCDVKVRRQHLQGKWWIEAGPELPVGLEVVEGPLVQTTEGRCKVNVLADCKVRVGPHQDLFQVRAMTQEDAKLLDKVNESDWQASEVHSHLLQCQVAATTEEQWKTEVERSAASAQFLQANYSKKDRAAQQEALFPELQKEIAKGREELARGVIWEDQSSEAYKDEVVKQSGPLFAARLTQKQKSIFTQRILRPFSAVLWLAGCRAPRVEGFTADIQLKPDAQARIQQPYKLSRYDQTRLEYHEDVEVAEGKAVWAEPGGSYCWGSPSFVVDQSGKGILGRPVRDYRWPNSQTLDTAWPAADVESCLRRAQSGTIHSGFDCVWGFTQVGLAEEAQKVLALITRRGLLLPKVLYFGPKQGPGIFQAMADSVLGKLRDEDGNEFVSVFVDDCTISTSGYGNETQEHVFDRHIRQLEVFFSAAMQKKIQFKLVKSRLGWSRIPLLGFEVGEGTRTVQAGKAKALEEWPDPKCLEDVVSFRAFANYLREFIPRFQELDSRLKVCTKKGVKWETWSADPENLAAFSSLRGALATGAALHMPDYMAAQDPESGRPLELFVDACEYGWGCTLAQRERAGGAPRPIACHAKSFSPTEQAWSTFERELCGMKEALAAVDNMTRGFPMIVYTDHKNNLFTGSLLSNKRMQKKLLRWTLEIEELGTQVQRVWLAGKDNILGDAPSRNPKDRDRIKELPVPAGPVKRVIRQMFEEPIKLEEELAEMNRFLSELEDTEPEKEGTAGTNDSAREGPQQSKIPETPEVLGDPVPPTQTASVEGQPMDSLPIGQQPGEGHSEVATEISDRSPFGGSTSRSSTAQVEPSGGSLEVSLSSRGSYPSSLDSEVLLHFEDDTDTTGLVVAKSWVQSKLDGTYPRFPLVSFLALGTGQKGRPAGLAKGTEADDARLPISDEVVPIRIYFTRNQHNVGNWIVEYPEPVECRDGGMRRKVFYACHKMGVDEDSVEAKEGFEAARVAAMKHVDFGKSPVASVHGRGPLLSGDLLKYHGHNDTDHSFYVHDSSPHRSTMSDLGLWRPGVDTRLSAKEFCSNCTFLRRSGTGVETWRCCGHEVDEPTGGAQVGGSSSSSSTDVGPGLAAKVEQDLKGPEEDKVDEVLFPGMPLQTRRFVETFSGDPTRGGGRLSETWRKAGGNAEQRDILLDAKKFDFLTDHSFWDKERKDPADAYHFAPPCTSFTNAHTTPIVRTAANPYGSPDDPQVVEGNQLAKLTVKRMLMMLEAGSHVLLENPLMSFFWALGEVQALMGMIGMYLVRIDQCTHGTPYKKPQLWLTSNPQLVSEGSVCYHPMAHPEKLVGSKARRSSPYPEDLCIVIVNAFDRCLNGGHAVPDATRKVARYLLGTLEDAEVKSSGLFKELEAAGAEMLNQCRHGTPAVSAEEVLNLLHDEPLTPAVTDSDPISVFTPLCSGKSKFEREQFGNLQRADADFKDIIVVLEVSLRLTQVSGSNVDQMQLYKECKKVLQADAGTASKRAESAIRQAEHYEMTDGLLNRVVLDSKCNEVGRRVVVPSGGMRSFHFNGRRYRLSMRKMLLLLYHDSESIGAHPGARDTLMKIAEVFWWPSMEADVQKWVRTCKICRMTKPSVTLTAEQRTELHDRPFRCIFIDTIGPIKPADGEFNYIAHAECPFSRYCWLKPLKSNTEAEWAEFLLQHVFFDLAGFPVVLRSDRGAEFTGSVVKAINDLLGVEHAFGAAYHPESQGYLEARHKPINMVLAAFARDNPGRWARRVGLAQWAMRATPREDREGKSPYELVTGLKPQGPLARVFARINPQVLTPSSYVKELCDHLQQVQQAVADNLSAEYQKRRFGNEKANTSSWLPQVGDFVLLKKPPLAASRTQETVSRKLQPKTDTKVYKVRKVVGSKSFVLEDPDTKSTEFAFSQPVALERLVPFDMADLEEPLNPTEELWLDIKSNQPGREEKWYTRKIAAQFASGAVRLTSIDGKLSEVIELADYEWRWRNKPTLPTDEKLACFGKYDPRKRDRNSPFAHPALGDTEAWLKVMIPLYRKYSPRNVEHVEWVLVNRYKGRETELYHAFMKMHEGDSKGKFDNKSLDPTVCRICGEAGHWGNECPKKTPAYRDRQANTVVRPPPVPPWRRKKADVKPKVQQGAEVEVQSQQSVQVEVPKVQGETKVEQEVQAETNIEPKVQGETKVEQKVQGEVKEELTEDDKARPSCPTQVSPFEQHLKDSADRLRHWSSSSSKEGEKVAAPWEKRKTSNSSRAAEQPVPPWKKRRCNYR